MEYLFILSQIQHRHSAMNSMRKNNKNKKKKKKHHCFVLLGDHLENCYPDVPHATFPAGCDKQHCFRCVSQCSWQTDSLSPLAWFALGLGEIRHTIAGVPLRRWKVYHSPGCGCGSLPATMSWCAVRWLMTSGHSERDSRVGNSVEAVLAGVLRGNTC